jgi:hypothetical protein
MWGAGVRSSRLLVMSVLAAASGCGILDVDNPNNLVQEDLEQPTAVTALVNGAQLLLAVNLGRVVNDVGLAADELTHIGSLDDWANIDQGHLSDFSNGAIDIDFNGAGEMRWTADEAIRLLEMFVQDDPANATLQEQLARAYVFGAYAYVLIAETFDDFVFSDRTEPGPAIGENMMVGLFDTAIDRLGQAIEIGRAEGLTEWEVRALALRARARHSRAIWESLNPPGQTPSEPLVWDPMMVADARAVLGAQPADWRYQFEYGADITQSRVSLFLFSRREVQIGPAFAETDPTNPRNLIGYRITDPIDDVIAPAFAATADAFVGGLFPSITVTSAREMRLILAEAALAEGDVDGFTTEINAVRMLDGLSPFTGQVDALERLEHSRAVNLFLQGRRLSDLYRFGLTSASWELASAAAQIPGTYLPIGITERQSNPNLGG